MEKTMLRGARKGTQGTGKPALSRLIWGLAGLAMLLLAMPAVSGKLRPNGQGAGEGVQAGGGAAYEENVTASGSGSTELSGVETLAAETAVSAGGGKPSNRKDEADAATEKEKADAGAGGGGRLSQGDADGDADSKPRVGVSGGAGGVAARTAGGSVTQESEDGSAAASGGETGAGDEGIPPSASVGALEKGGAGEEPKAGEGGYLSMEGGDAAVPDLGRSLLKVLLSLGVVAILVLATRAFLKRAGRKGRARAGETYLKVIGFTPLGNGTGVHEVRVGERIWFIAEGEKGLRLLGDFDLYDLEVTRMAREGGEGGEFHDLVSDNIPSRSAEWRGTVPKGWLNALRWKTAR